MRHARPDDLWTGHLTIGVIGPIAVQPRHTPFDPLAVAGEAAILDDREVYGVDPAVAGHCAATAIAARNVVGLPGTERDLMDIAVTRDSQRGIPKGAFFLSELLGDGGERSLAGCDAPLPAWPEQAEIQF